MPLSQQSFNSGKNNLIGYLNLYNTLLENNDVKLYAHDINEVRGKSDDELAQWLKDLSS